MKEKLEGEPFSLLLRKSYRTPKQVLRKMLERETDFPSYSTARALVGRLGEKVNVRIGPHDLWRYWATYASRNGVHLEVVSKVILRHQDLKTTQVYIGKISDTETIRWMDILHGK